MENTVKITKLAINSVITVFPEDIILNNFNNFPFETFLKIE